MVKETNTVKLIILASYDAHTKLFFELRAQERELLERTLDNAIKSGLMLT